MSIVESAHLIDLKDLTMVYDAETEALSHLNLYIRKKEFVTLLGPSGCGKTTTLRLIAGFETPSSGQVIFEGKDITHLPPYKRRVNTVFQKYALFPHMNVFENVAFGLRLKKADEKQIRLRVSEMLEMVGLRGFDKRKVDTLSGGQQQRVAIARALANRPEVLLLDEPLGALDLKLRKEMQLELKNMQQQLGITFLYVTHDQEEALSMSDTIVVMKDGLVQQIGTPTELYNRPANRFVHKFLGQSTFTDVVIQDGTVYAKGDMEQPLPVALPENGEREMVMATRPNQIAINHTDGYKTKIEKRIFLSIYTEYLVRVGDQLLQVQTPHRNAFAQGETCYLKFPGIMWYGREDEQAEAERNRRQLV